MVFSATREIGAEAQVAAAMADAGARDLDAYALALDEPAVLDALVDALVIGETFFFRDAAQLELIQARVVPDVAACHPDRALRAWSAGCATGEEAYSVAIALAEASPPSGFTVLATDVSRSSLARAAAGRYREWSLRGAGAARARPYLSRDGDRWCVAPALRARVDFAYLNLAGEAFPAAATGTADLDLVLCRNVLIYFDPAAVERTARKLFAALAPGGFGSCSARRIRCWARWACSRRSRPAPASCGAGRSMRPARWRRPRPRHRWRRLRRQLRRPRSCSPPWRRPRLRRLQPRSPRPP